MFPPALIKQLTDEQGKWCAKPGGAVDDAAALINKVTASPAAIYPHLEGLFRMLAGLLKDTQFKTIMTLLKAIEVRVLAPEARSP